MCVKRMSSRSCLGRFSQFAIPTLTRGLHWVKMGPTIIYLFFHFYHLQIMIMHCTSQHALIMHTNDTINAFSYPCHHFLEAMRRREGGLFISSSNLAMEGHRNFDFFSSFN